MLNPAQHFVPSGIMADRVTIRIPASTSNIGPGFDCLGIALALYNWVTLIRAGEATFGAPQHPMVADCARQFFDQTGQEAFGFKWSVAGEVPVSRGLGSSVTLRLGILTGLNELSGRPLSREGIFDLCARIEGNPDNAAPSSLGGFVLTDAQGKSFRFEVGPELNFVLLVPEMEVLTTDSRRVLPASIAHRDAVINCGNACMITAAFAMRQYEKLAGCFGDALHQPWRAPLVPGLFEVIAAGEKAGALGGFLSGSGSSICCLALAGQEQAVAGTMLAAWPGPAHALVRIVSADNEGLQILR